MYKGYFFDLKKFWQWSSRCSLLAVGLTTLACGGGGKSISPASGFRSSGDALASLDCRQKGAKLTLEQGEFRHIPAEEVVGRLEESPLSLCGVMRANPDVKLALFQYQPRVLCLSKVD